jgi:hypothetical protein
MANPPRQNLWVVVAVAIVLGIVLVSVELSVPSGRTSTVTETITSSATLISSVTLVSNRSLYVLPTKCIFSDFSIKAASPPNNSTVSFTVDGSCQGAIGPVVISVNNAGVYNGFLTGGAAGMDTEYQLPIPQGANVAAGQTCSVLVWIYPFLNGASGDYAALVSRNVYSVTAT